MIHLDGILVFVDDNLPVHETARACEIETREEHDVLTGNMVHCFKIEGKLYVSHEFYKSLEIALLNKTDKTGI